MNEEEILKKVNESLKKYRAFRPGEKWKSIMRAVDEVYDNCKKCGAYRGDMQFIGLCKECENASV